MDPDPEQTEGSADGMSIHIMFTDGSNPYIRYNMDPETFAGELLRWAKTFRLEFAGVIGEDIIQFTAAAKTGGRPGFSPEE